MGKKGQLRIHFPWLWKLSCVDGSAHRYFYSSILLPFSSAFDGELTKHRYWVILLYCCHKSCLNKKRKKEEWELWSPHSVSSRESHNQSLSPLKFFFREGIFQLLVQRCPGPMLASESPFREFTFSWVTAAKFSSGYTLQRKWNLEHISLSPACKQRPEANLLTSVSLTANFSTVVLNTMY